MDMGVPRTIGRIAGTEALHELYSIMGVSWENQGEVKTGLHQGDPLAGSAFPPALIPEMISTGLPDILMPVCSKEETGCHQA